MKNYFRRNKKASISLAIGIVILGFFIFTFALISSPLNSGGKKFSIFIPTNNDGKSVENAILDSLYKNSKSPSILYYKWKVTAIFKSSDKFPPGKYTIDGDLSARSIFNKLLSGNQDPVSIRIDNIKTIYKLAQRFAKNFEQDSAKFMGYVNGNLNELAPNTNDLPLEIRQQRVLERILGDTYELYWTSSPANFFSKMK
jgi:cell division protein YceG involved in septum cleavage